MKKRILAVIFATLMATMMICLSSCGNVMGIVDGLDEVVQEIEYDSYTSYDVIDESGAELVSSGADFVSSGADLDLDVSEDNATIAEYAELAQEQFGTDEMMGMKIDIAARGNSLVYLYTFIDVDETTEEQADQIAVALDEQFGDGALLEMIMDECPEVESVIFEYYESDGDLVISKEYK